MEQHIKIDLKEFNLPVLQTLLIGMVALQSTEGWWFLAAECLRNAWKRKGRPWEATCVQILQKQWNQMDYLGWVRRVTAGCDP